MGFVTYVLFGRNNNVENLSTVTCNLLLVLRRVAKVRFSMERPAESRENHNIKDTRARIFPEKQVGKILQ